jgi:hypothetical protein
MSRSVNVNISFSGSVVLEKIFKLPYPIFPCCDYLPVEEDMTLYLKYFNSLYARMTLT